MHTDKLFAFGTNFTNWVAPYFVRAAGPPTAEGSRARSTVSLRISSNPSVGSAHFFACSWLIFTGVSGRRP
jgi:hypothetical protein